MRSVQKAFLNILSSIYIELHYNNNKINKLILYNLINKSEV